MTVSWFLAGATALISTSGTDVLGDSGLQPLLATARNPPVGWTSAADTVPWILPDLRQPVRFLRSPPAAVFLLRLGRARIPVTRFGPVPAFLAGDAATADFRLGEGTGGGLRNPPLRFGRLGRTVDAARISQLREEKPPARGQENPRFRTEFADLGFSLRGTGQFGGEWTRFRPCDESVQETCEVSLLPRIQPDIRFAVTADGTITNRIRVDVDYDQTREFAGANQVNIRYQGLPGEALQRLNLGDVRFDLPPSRYLREAIPAGNFGFQAALQAGPVDVQAVWAQQTGEVTSRRLRLEGSGRSVSRADTLVLDDADYVDGQFFFLFDPAAFFDYPYVDVLSLTPSDAPPAVAPGTDPIQLYRSETDLYARQQVEGHVQADAFASLEADTVSESAWFRYLQPGQDYVVHPSGLWVVLRSPLRPDEMLAVTYVTATGDTVGTYNPERAHRKGERPRLRLLRASSAQHQPGGPTWRTEMHQVYRVSSSNEVDPGSVELTVSLGEQSAGRTFARHPNGDDVTWMRLFGLDEEAPADRLDESQVYRPALDSFDDRPPVSGIFIIFPALEPFANPAPLRSLSLDPEEVRKILGSNRNARIYRETDPFERENGGVFRLNLSYEVRGEGPLSSFALGAVGIREGTERVVLGDRVLERDADYVIDYDVGHITLTDPTGLLATNLGRTLDVSWEQRSFFQVAPTSVLGVNARYDMGDYGTVNLTSLYQNENELVRRPQLGVEAGAVGLGGVNGNLNLDAPFLTRVLNAIPGLAPGDTSSVRLSGETAVSLPNPNTQGDVYLDDYDGLNNRLLSVRSPDWRRGSRPSFRDGAEEVLPPVMSAASAAQLTWQHVWIKEGVGGDSLGVFQGFSPSADIDQQIRIRGSAVREPGLFVRFRPGSGNVEGLGAWSAWSSITTVLSPTGADLTKSDFIEFYIRDGDLLNLILDVGVVSEDAFFVHETGVLNGIKPGAGVQWGLGVLDQEADPRRGEVWGNVADGRGVWDEICFAQRGRVYRLGDPAANCTRGNGRPDSEDLNEDGNLDTLERYRRFVIPLNGSSPFLVRDREETGTAFRLYRVPLRDPSGLDVGGSIADAELRAVRHLRLTVTGKRTDSFVLARMGIVGSTWIKRSLSGVLKGLGGSEGSVQGRVEVGPVSRLTAGESYASPPGVIEQLDDPTAAFGGQGIEFNERSLSVRFQDVPPGDRVEVYNRFPQRPRDFLSYREMRLWAVAPKGGFGAGVPSYFFVKVGTDDRNFYLYRTRLDPAASSRAVQKEDWLPEVVIRFDEWLALRRQAEEQLILEGRTPGDSPLVIWSADSAYAVVLQDRGRAPNLASVREIAMGMANETNAPVSGELWVNELRLSRSIRDGDMVAAFDTEVRGGDFLYSRATYRSHGGFFRQLRGNPSFQDDRALDLLTTLQLDRFAPGSWGLDMPLSVTYEREDQAPIFLGRSDVRADRLPGLRNPGFKRTRIDLSLRRRSRSDGGFWNAVLDGFALRGGATRSFFQTITTRSEGGGIEVFAGYAANPGRGDIPLFPGRMSALVRAILPSFLEERVANARLRWTPESFRFESDFLKRDLSTFRFDRIVESADDAAASATESPRRLLTTMARVVLRPLESLTTEADLVSGRDLLDVERLTSDPETRALIATERRRTAGVDLGWEVDRQLRTRISYRPRLPDWANTSLQMNTLYLSQRNPDLKGSGPGSDPTPVLLRNVDGQRNLTATFSLHPGQLPPEEGRNALIDWWARSFDPLSVTWSNGFTSRFNRDSVEPGAGYQLGWGGRTNFLRIGTDSAATLGEGNRISARGGLRLPGSASVGLAYDRSLAETLDTRSDRESLRRVWPDVRAEVADMPLPGFFRTVVARLSASSGYRKEMRSLAFGTGTQQSRFREDRSIPVSLTLGFPESTTLIYRSRLDRGKSVDPAGNTKRAGSSHSLLASATFPSPLKSFRERGAPLRITLDLRYRNETQCRVGSLGSPCVAFIDQLERIASLSLDSSLRDFQLGLRFRYLDRRSFVGQQVGTTRFQLNLFGHFLLTPDLLLNSS